MAETRLAGRTGRGGGRGGTRRRGRGPGGGRAEAGCGRAEKNSPSPDGGPGSPGPARLSPRSLPHCLARLRPGAIRRRPTHQLQVPNLSFPSPRPPLRPCSRRVPRLPGPARPPSHSPPDDELGPLRQSLPSAPPFPEEPLLSAGLEGCTCASTRAPAAPRAAATDSPQETAGGVAGSGGRGRPGSVATTTAKTVDSQPTRPGRKRVDGFPIAESFCVSLHRSPLFSLLPPDTTTILPPLLQRASLRFIPESYVGCSFPPECRSLRCLHGPLPHFT
ncbi:cuticle collagen 2C-like [Felis catus]|uniref:cuticle collagen 2C-like n=1 Tax=Felis catus TaxID=9685 RepID=UPI001D1A272A|nr:cuticle collagen 2C-like [Felis catus]